MSEKETKTFKIKWSKSQKHSLIILKRGYFI